VALFVPGNVAELAAAHRAVSALAQSVPPVLYVGPDQLLPLTSVFGAILGIVLMFWRWLIAFARKCWMAVTGRTRQAPKSEITE